MYIHQREMKRKIQAKNYLNVTMLQSTNLEKAGRTYHQLACSSWVRP